ncbi:hypothetical protein BO82DRAFT_397319 [Aspergillus uvarum CBS 121591]|uniref:Uncharacterized protein n=1 Tax=Aspergillus uvarum CBS 121591 TaxID=1448315 RepID=A0A319D742_9EURO|nr:hypothetical protein BO82DRAFT_397319 [Aspergillus uvarum CBS 121591]PYH86743.1 hypothetical protein BO82DRAFT_397319 [Aspergillus uvarum CBS 121591]
MEQPSTSMLRQFEEPAVVGLQPWQTVEAVISGKHFGIAGSPFAVLNMGNALFPTPKGMMQITFNGQQIAHLMRVFGGMQWCRFTLNLGSI